MESEIAILGNILLNNDTYFEVSKTITGAWEFTESKHRAVYNAIVELIDSGETADLLTVTDKLMSENKLDSAGGSTYISSLTDIGTGNIQYHVRKVHDSAVKDFARKALGKALTKLNDEFVDGEETIQEVEKAILEIAEYKSGNYEHVKNLVMGEINLIEDRYNNKVPKGIMTGIHNIDRYTTGFNAGELIILAARPSIGKTALAFSMARNISYDVPVGFFSLEMGHDVLMDRFISMESRIPLEAITTGNIANVSHFNKLTNGATKIHDYSNMYIFDTPNADLNDIRGQARKMVKHEDVKIIFIDYVSLITVKGKYESRQQQVSFITKQIKQLARELNIPIVLLAQVNRKAEGEKPSLAELKESGSLEEDSDMVLILHRDRNSELAQYEANCEIAKHRNGAIGDALLNFIPAFTVFENGDVKQTF